MCPDIERVVAAFTECPTMKLLARRTLTEMKANNFKITTDQTTWAQCLVLAFYWIQEGFTMPLGALCRTIENWWCCYRDQHAETLGTVMAGVLMTRIMRVHKLPDYENTIDTYCSALATVTKVTSCTGNQHVFNKDSIHVLLDLVGDLNNYWYWSYASDVFATLSNIVQQLDNQDVRTGVAVTMHALRVDCDDVYDLLRENACKFLSKLTKRVKLCAADIAVLVKLINTCTDRDVMEYACKVVVNIADQDDRRAMLGDTIESMLDLLANNDDCAFEACKAIHAVTQLASNAKRCVESCGLETLTPFYEKMYDDLYDDPRDMDDWWNNTYRCVIRTLDTLETIIKPDGLSCI
jgi:hypothetical protein